MSTIRRKLSARPWDRRTLGSLRTHIFGEGIANVAALTAPPERRSFPHRSVPYRGQSANTRSARHCAAASALRRGVLQHQAPQQKANRSRPAEQGLAKTL